MQRDLFKGRIVIPPLPSSTSSGGSKGKVKVNPEHCNVLGWENYFDSMRDVEIPSTRDTFRVYEAGSSGPLFVLLHGGGYTSLSWAIVASLLKGSCRVLAIDFRGHGSTRTEDESDLSHQVLVNDIIAVIEALYTTKSTDIEEDKADDRNNIIVVGHSLGGAIAVKLSITGKVKGQVGLIVIDVVEGTALAALAHMQTILSNRPGSFPSIEKAIEWSISSGTLKNIESARISIPSQLIQKDNGSSSNDTSSRWYWRTNLSASEPHWIGWFTNLSNEFLSTKMAKMLLLAGTDRLDRSLTIGQMQGKFQLTVLPKVGHVIQEDDPVTTANTLLEFAKRNKWL